MQERSRSLALVYSGMYSGSIAGLAISPTLIANFSWPSVFFIFGSLGSVWFAMWSKFASSSPREDKFITASERSYITANTIERGAAEKVPWRKILSSRPVWAIIVCHFCHNWGTFILLTWMPTYYNQVREDL
jgi:ACS family sodium-dependent inorganic phosphate cotransporter